MARHTVRRLLIVLGSARLRKGRRRSSVAEMAEIQQSDCRAAGTSDIRPDATRPNPAPGPTGDLEARVRLRIGGELPRQRVHGRL